MRVLATAMLAGMAAIFVAATGLEAQHPAWGFVRAFAEAGLVGGIADWFAVTALFRHPLGIPIPHTAIIPRNKDRIGDALASFLRDNFLTPRVVARRMRSLDVAGAVGRFLAQPPRRRRAPARGRLAPARRHPGRRSIRSGSAAWSRPRSPSASAASRSRLCSARRWRRRSPSERHVPLVDSIVSWAGRTLDANEDLIRDMVHQRAGRILRMVGLDEKLADAIVDGLRKLTIDMAIDPDHPVRAKAEEGLANLARNLQHDPETRAKVEAWKSDMVENEAVSALARRRLGEGARRPAQGRARSRRRARRQVRRGAAPARRDAADRAAAQGARSTSSPAAPPSASSTSYGDGIVKLVSETVRSWDARTVSDRLEGAVGRDLQYIRINGTLVGGLVGLVLHTIEVAT